MAQPNFPNVTFFFEFFYLYLQVAPFPKKLILPKMNKIF